MGGIVAGVELSDTDILSRLSSGELVIKPIEDMELQIQPASVDVRLDSEFLTFTHQNMRSFNPLTDTAEQFMNTVTVDGDETFVLHPGDFVLASTIERVEVPTDLIGFVNGRSTLGRVGVVIHATAGLLDPGYTGTITLEMSNLGSVPVELTPNMRIGQLTFTQLQSECSRPYGEERGSKYQNQSGVQAARVDDTSAENSLLESLDSG